MASTVVGSCWALGKKPAIQYEGQIMSTYYLCDEYASFLGIPYAACPKGRKRCQAPEPFSPATTPDESIPTYKANVKGKMCTQLDDKKPPRFSGSSDCLYLNIFLPKDPAEIEELLPVLVFIHGGGFKGGSNNEEDIPPDFIVQHGLVFVTINYRLGVLGFGNLRTEDCPGNAGLKDQVMALEWIRDNIESFKGDPKNVTISGNSAGASSVNMHLINPKSKDLFHKAIVQSGGIYTPWGYRGHDIELKQTLSRDAEFQQLLFDKDESMKLHERACSLLDEFRLNQHPNSMAPGFGPSVEKFREGAFIPDTIEEMMKHADFAHDKPVMAGITEHEGIFLLTGGVRKDSDESYDAWVKDGYQTLPFQFLMDNLRWSFETTQKCFHEIRNKYFPNGQLETCRKKKAQCVVNLVQDVCLRRFYDNFKFGPEKTLHKKLFVYRFDHVSQLSAVRQCNLKYFHGATHGDDTYYLYCPDIVKEELREFIYEGYEDQNPEIMEVINHMCSLWAHFCRNGDFDSSNVEWRRHTEEAPCFLSISNNLRLVEESLYAEEWGWLNALVSAHPTVPSPAVTPK